MDGLQLGRLVHDVLGCSHLAAIVQPGGHVYCLPVVFAQLEVTIGTAVGCAGGTRQHLGQLGDTRAVAAGVWALGIDGSGDQLDESFEEVLLRLDERLALERHRGRTG